MVQDEMSEVQLRTKLNIPKEAEKVLIFTETSHWDPDWLLTSEEYFHLRVKRQLIKAVRELLKEPRRIYGVECVFFLKMLYDHVPSIRDDLFFLIKEKRLRMLGVGITTPDTIIPSSEALLRDYLLGLKWIKEHFDFQGITTAFLPDSFGFSPAIVDIYAHLGFDSVALCRLDGMYFLGNETEMPHEFPKVGSSAYKLMREEKTLDFFFESPNGNKILTHWLAYTYGQGELLTHVGITRLLGLPFALYFPNKALVAKRVARYVRQLSKYTKSPYMLCPIGFDFSYPIKNLINHLDVYNEFFYPKTGIWVTNLGLDDYFALQKYHLNKFPVLRLDPVNYFTGFYSSRITLKSLYHSLVSRLLNTEIVLAYMRDLALSRQLQGSLEELWQISSFANHHDFITGTSPDRVVNKEQKPLLKSALKQIDQIQNDLFKYAELKNLVVQQRNNASLSQHVKSQDDLKFEKEAFNKLFVGGDLIFSRCLTVDLINDSGGLWRMGNEYKGGTFKPVAAIDVETSQLGQDKKNEKLKFYGEYQGNQVIGFLSLSPRDKKIVISSTTKLQPRTTAVMRFNMPFVVNEVLADTQTCLIKREFSGRFYPTFWPFQNLILLKPFDHSKLEEIVIVAPFGTAYYLQPGDESSFGIIVARNAIQELAYGSFILPAFPARGHEVNPVTYNFEIHFRFDSDPAFNYLDLIEQAKLSTFQDNKSSLLIARALESFVVKSIYAKVTSVKNATFGDGVILRIKNLSGRELSTELQCKTSLITQAFEVTGMERNVKELAVRQNSVLLKLQPGLNSVRIILEN